MIRGSAGSLRTVGIDDGYFPLRYKEKRLKTILVGVLCIDTIPRHLSIETITVDGFEGTKVAYEIVKELESTSGERVNMIFTDGVTIAGFNVIDPELLWRLTQVPVVTVFKHDLNMAKIGKALKLHFMDWRERLEIIERTYKSSMLLWTKWRKLRMTCYGISCHKAASIISILQSSSPLPEPLRLADIIASGLTREGVILKLINKGS